jgi:hypothetical protein
MERLATVINLFAGPGAGKSTTCAGIFSLLKLHGIECEMVTEYAKDMVWEGRNFVFKNQLYILGKQYHRFLRLKDKVDFIITDSPILLSAVYGEDEPDCFKEVVFNKFCEFVNFNFYIERVKPYHQIGRNQTENEAKDIDDIVKNKLDEYKISYDIVPGDFRGINMIATMICRELAKVEFKYYFREVL